MVGLLLAPVIIFAAIPLSVIADTTPWNFVIGLLTLLVLAALARKFTVKTTTHAKLFISLIICLSVNLIPLPLPGYSSSLSGYSEPASIAIGWPATSFNYYIGDTTYGTRRPIYLLGIVINLVALIVGWRLIYLYLTKN